MNPFLAIFEPSSTLIGHSGHIFGNLGTLLGLLGPNLSLPMSPRPWKNLGFVRCLCIFHFSTIWALSRPSSPHVRRLGAGLGPSWAILGPFWGHLGRTLRGTRCSSFSACLSESLRNRILTILNRTFRAHPTHLQLSPAHLSLVPAHLDHLHPTLVHLGPKFGLLGPSDEPPTMQKHWFFICF